MQIQSIVIGKLTIPLIRPFITAVRRTDAVQDIVVKIHTTCGKVGFGSAASTPLITGDSEDSIIGAIKDILAPKLINKNISDFNQLIELNQRSLQKNTSAKAAIDIALHDLFAQNCNLPLYKLFGGNQNQISSCITISVKDKDEMVSDAIELTNQGFKTLKIKVGLDAQADIERIRAIANSVSKDIKLVIDANQGWTSKSSLQIIQQIKQSELDIAFIEQPVIANDLANLKFVHDNSTLSIFADESCFSPQDALNIANLNAADGLNIKLMKCGGLKNADSIYNIAKSSNMQVMVGCMLESPIGVAAIASFAISKPDIYFADLDPIALIQQNPIQGGAQISGNIITLSNDPGLGIKSLGNNYTDLYEVK